MSVEAYPLSWPEGWARHKGDRDNDRRFRGPLFTWDRVYRGLVEELTRLGAKNIVVSTNQPVRLDGIPYAQQRSINDTGVAVYFTLKDKALVMAQDRFNTVIGNMRSVAMAVEGLRQVERHGGGYMMERAFTGFLAIAPPSWKKPWREVMGFKTDTMPTAKELRARFLALMRERHPDTATGSASMMAELNDAHESALTELGIV